MRAFEKTAVVYRMLYAKVHPTDGEMETAPFFMLPTIFENSTANTIFMGFEMMYLTDATAMTVYAEGLTMHFDWQMIVISV
jgi:hypothetical protein